MVGRGKILDFRFFFFFLPFFSILFLKGSCWFWCLGNLDEWMEHSGFQNKRSTGITQPQTFHEYFHLWHKVPLSPSCLQRQNTVMNPRSDMTLALDCHCWFLAFLQWALSYMLGEYMWNVAEMEQQSASCGGILLLKETLLTSIAYGFIELCVGFCLVTLYNSTPHNPVCCLLVRVIRRVPVPQACLVWSTDARRRLDFLKSGILSLSFFGLTQGGGQHNRYNCGETPVGFHHVLTPSARLNGCQ